MSDTIEETRDFAILMTREGHEVGDVLRYIRSARCLTLREAADFLKGWLQDAKLPVPEVLNRKP